MEIKIYSETDLFRAYRLFEKGLSFDDIIKEFNNSNQFQDGDITELISEAVVNYFKIQLEDLQSSRRLRSLVDARSVFYYLMRKYTNKSLADIGGMFNRNHATVINGLNYVNDMLFCNDPKITESLSGVEKTYKEYLSLRQKVKNDDIQTNFIWHLKRQNKSSVKNAFN